jgi:hypothetical protein
LVFHCLSMQMLGLCLAEAMPVSFFPNSIFITTMLRVHICKA